MLSHILLKRRNKIDYKKFVALHERRFKDDLEYLRFEMEAQWAISDADMGDLWGRFNDVHQRERYFKQHSKRLYKDYCKDTYNFEIRKEIRR